MKTSVIAALLGVTFLSTSVVASNDPSNPILLSKCQKLIKRLENIAAEAASDGLSEPAIQRREKTLEIYDRYECHKVDHLLNTAVLATDN